LNRKRKRTRVEDNNSNSGISEELNIIVNDEEDLVKEKENNRHAINILSNAELKILLTADFETHVQRRLNQLESNNYNTISLDIIKQDILSIEFIKEIIKLSTIFIIDTTYLSIEEVVDKILLKTSNTITNLKLGEEDYTTEKSLKLIGEEIEIIYNSEKLQKPLTKQAKIWWKSCCSEIKILNEKEALTEECFIVIVAFGLIGARKTTFLNELKDYFEKQELKVYLPEEMSLRLGQDLEYGFMFQDLLIDTYQEENEIIRKDEYDIYLIDRTAKDIKIFSEILIDNKLKLDYFKKKLKREEQINVKFNFFIKCSPEICYERKIERNRKSEKVSLEYLKSLCESYEKNAFKLYSKHIVFNTDDAKVEEYNT
ncbi:28593_t:CDS:2, partial [Racocetra persica]